MNKKWQAEIRKIISNSHREIKKIRAAQEDQKKARAMKIQDIKRILLPKLEFVKNIMNKDQELGREPSQNDLPKIRDAESEVEFIMPELSEVNKMDMHYRIDFNDDNTAILHAYDKSSIGKMDHIGSTENDYELFIEENNAD